MGLEDRNAAALVYAWWLTGEEEAARDVAASVAASARLATAGDDDRLPTLLREVRAAAPARTMCPASELALLHDAHGLALDAAAALVGVDEADARVELAHGRLEALPETVLDPFTHPERLGGLAVGNPADVAHARQCPSCEEARRLVERGRGELLDLAAEAVDGALGAAPAETPGAVQGRSPSTQANGRMVVVGLAAIAIVVVALLVFGAGA